MTATVTNTEGMLALVMNAKGRNRSAYEDRVHSAIDPDGIHVLSFQMLHGDFELRTLWLVKIRETETPVEIWLDVDIDMLDKCCTEIEVDA